jgi:hypothetical protein
MDLTKFHLSVLEKSTELDLCVATTEQLYSAMLHNEKPSSKSSMYIREIHKAIIGVGGKLLPLEVAAQLRVQHCDQLDNECLFVATKLIIDASENYSCFVVANNKKMGLVLDAYKHLIFSNFSHFYNTQLDEFDVKWVFAIPRSE